MLAPRRIASRRMATILIVRLLVFIPGCWRQGKSWARPKARGVKGNLGGTVADLLGSSVLVLLRKEVAANMGTSGEAPKYRATHSGHRRGRAKGIGITAFVRLGCKPGTTVVPFCRANTGMTPCRACQMHHPHPFEFGSHKFIPPLVLCAVAIFWFLALVKMEKREFTFASQVLLCAPRPAQRRPPPRGATSDKVISPPPSPDAAIGPGRCAISCLACADVSRAGADLSLASGAPGRREGLGSDMRGRRTGSTPRWLHSSGAPQARTPVPTPRLERSRPAVVF